MSDTASTASPPCTDKPIPSKVPDLRGVPLVLIPALDEDEGPSFGSSI